MLEGGRRLVVHCKREPFDVYIGRPSRWGNPYSHLARGTKARFVVATREQAIEAYELYLVGCPELVAALPELRGKVLGCWCAPKPCHGDVLVRLANVSNVVTNGPLNP
jgi:hypothetical protein